jgi:hypothetical protein
MKVSAAGIQHKVILKAHSASAILSSHLLDALVHMAAVMQWPAHQQVQAIYL